LSGIIEGGVSGGDDTNFSPSLLRLFKSVRRTSPGEGGGIYEPPELNEDATESVESAPMCCVLEVGVIGS
jgi:hypothetical protein